MLHTLAIANYRSLRELVMPLGALTVVHGGNGSGKSSLYRALRLLAASAQSGVADALAREGGFASALWAGPEQFGRSVRAGQARVEGVVRSAPVSLKLGFGGDPMGYCVELGLPKPDATSLFSGDPEIKRECIFAGPFWRPSGMLLDRRGPGVRARGERGQWETLCTSLPAFESMLVSIADPQRAPEALDLRERMRGWRFYDQFRADAEAPARRVEPGTRTPVLAHDGRDLAAAWQTICEIGDVRALDAAIEDAFPGCSVQIQANDGRFTLLFQQHGLLRPLTAAELSDGTLRYLLWIAALMTPRPPELMVLNEPETSLHPDLLPAFARLMRSAARRSQIWVVSHAARLIASLGEDPGCSVLELDKELSETRIRGQGLLDAPAWYWPER